MNGEEMRAPGARRLVWGLILGVASAGWAACAESPPLRGIVLDPAGAGVPRARISVIDQRGATLHHAITGEDGRFELESVLPGSYALRAEAEGFSASTIALQHGWSPGTATIQLSIASLASEVTVTANRGAVEEAGSSAQLVTVRGRDTLLSRPLTALPAALDDAPGVLVQQTTPGQASVFVRGLTGYHTLILVDGVRYNTSTFRSGPNQYLAYIQPAQVQALEVVNGPAASLFGGDSLGGVIQVLTRQPPAPEGARRAIHGSLSAMAATADLSANSSAEVGGGTARVNWLFGAGHQRHNNLRAGNASDSHNVFRRYFDLTQPQIRSLLGPRLRDTAFGQYGAYSRFSLRPRQGQSLTVWYQRGDQFGVRSYRDLLGGLGRLQASLEPQTLNFFYVRYENVRAGPLASWNATFSLNSQRDGSTTQGRQATDMVLRDRNRVDAFGYAAQGSANLSPQWVSLFGFELYRERVRSGRQEMDPRTGESRSTRALYPDRSRYSTAGVFLHNSIEAWGRRLRAQAGARLTDVRFRMPADGAGFGDSRRKFGDLSFHGSIAWQVVERLGLHAMAGRAFRAPNLNDLGGVGLTGLGFEVPAEEAARRGAFLARDSSEQALSTGARVGSLRPETLWNYEAGARLTLGRLYARAQLFTASFENAIVRRTLLFPAAAVPEVLAGVPVNALTATPDQRRQAVVTIATDLDPRAVKAFVNHGAIRYSGIEARLRYVISRQWSLEAGYSYIDGWEVESRVTPRRLPPKQVNAALRWAPRRGGFWLEAGGTGAGAQRRLNPGDRDDERIGASRRRSDIAAFFNSTVVSPLVDAGSDGRRGTGDDLFLPTSETLRQIQDRVLPLAALMQGVLVSNDSSRVPLLSETPAWFSVYLHGGFPVRERWNLVFGLSNPLDRNYRVHGSGVDAAGFSAYTGVTCRF